MQRCIHAHAPYLRHTLNSDNLPPFCKHVSVKVLRRKRAVRMTITGPPVAAAKHYGRVDRAMEVIWKILMFTEAVSVG